MKLTSTSFANGQRIPGTFAFCIPDADHHVCLGKNLNPQLAWSDVPAGTRSFAIICHDPDVPSKGCLLYTSPSPRDRTRSRMPSSA